MVDLNRSGTLFDKGIHLLDFVFQGIKMIFKLNYVEILITRNARDASDTVFFLAFRYNYCCFDLFLISTFILSFFQIISTSFVQFMLLNIM